MMPTKASWNIETVYQPIIELKTGKRIGYEALTRDVRLKPLSPEALFDKARRQGRLFELEILARQRAIHNRPPFPPDGKLFLNVAPDVLLDPMYQEGLTLKELASVGLLASSVVLEVTERFQIYDPPSLATTIVHYHHQGFSIALDDFGSGYANLNLLAQIAPRYIKLDRQLISGIAQRPRQQHIVQAMIAFAQASHCHLIAEGIETYEDLIWLQQMDIELGQGYYLGRPAPSRFWQGKKDPFWAHTVMSVDRGLELVGWPLPRVDHPLV